MCIDIQVLYLLFLKKNSSCFDLFEKRIKDYVIGGDVNINFLKHDYCTLTIQILDCISSVGIEQFFVFQTRYSADFSSNSLIDHVYSTLIVKF